MKDKIFKRYLLFQFYAYYPEGGLGDCDDFETIEECKAIITKNKGEYNFTYIFDRLEGKVIFDTGYTEQV